MMASSPGYREYSREAADRLECDKARAQSRTLVDALLEAGLVPDRSSASSHETPPAATAADWLSKAIAAGWSPPGASPPPGSLPPPAFPPEPPVSGSRDRASSAPAGSRSATPTTITGAQKSLLEHLIGTSLADDECDGAVACVIKQLKVRDNVNAVGKFLKGKGIDVPRQLDARAKQLITTVRGL